ncbi:hypothetical protein [Flagellimonas okinawensis]|uniref:Lipoprotein n=1 Tax=Flagellimonas okinawensis TaxID=3031324 RepID=A0ABT5XRG6_9FLAO|nr:hypothetical protein [[Muricauda] okinawensis]MDF0708481.1 hypothetical protein [[Muricauda] okinawensis]
MRLNFAKYLIITFLLASCRNQEKATQEYGLKIKGANDLNVAVHMSDFDNYKIFLDRLNEIVCSDSIPKIVLETENKIRNIYPIVYCETPLVHPIFKNTFFIRRDSIVKNERKVKFSELSILMKENFENMGEKADFAESPEKVLFIFEFYRNTGVDGIERYLEIITKSYDSLNTKEDLKITFWPKIDVIIELEDGELKYDKIE